MMDPMKEVEEKLREATCIGDLDAVKKLVVDSGVDVNSQNSMNGWSALHWAAKRGHKSIIMYLLQNGADKNLETNNGEKASQLSQNEELCTLLGGEPNGELRVTREDLPITPNYISHPPFPYLSSSLKPIHDDSPVNLSVSSTPPQQNATSQQNNMLNHQNGCPDQDEDELVLKIRVANAMEADFIEVELPRDELTFENLLSTMCTELEVDRKLVQKVRKLPDTKVRKDKDVRRLRDFQELELVLTNKAMSESSRNYNQAPAQRHVDVVY